VRGSEKAKFTKEFTRARLPGQCEDIWAARGFQGIKIHLISKPSSSSPIFAEVCLLYVLCDGVMIQKEDYNHNLMQEIHGGMMGVLQAYALTVCLFSRQCFLISPLFIFH